VKAFVSSLFFTAEVANDTHGNMRTLMPRLLQVTHWGTEVVCYLNEFTDWITDCWIWHILLLFKDFWLFHL